MAESGARAAWAPEHPPKTGGVATPESGIEIRRTKYLNNIVEQDHRAVKRLTGPMLGFNCFTHGCGIIADGWTPSGLCVLVFGGFSNVNRGAGPADNARP